MVSPSKRSSVVDEENRTAGVMRERSETAPSRIRDIIDHARRPTITKLAATSF
jgi:hypothetical protein